jgi:hypothetical protein
MICTGPEGPDPVLPEVHIEGVRLELADPEDGRSGAVVTWSWPEGERVSSFEIFQGFRRDSLGPPAAEVPAPATTTARLRLPDSSRPLVLYYAVRAVFEEATGQKLYSKSMPIESLVVNPSLQILSPASRSRHEDRGLDVEVKTSSDEGIVVRQALYERTADGWNRQLDTCLPRDRCGIPIFGSTVQRDALILQALSPGDTVECLFCVLGDESFDPSAKGGKQSLGCSRFYRTGP